MKTSETIVAPAGLRKPEADAGPDFHCIVCGSPDWCGCEDRIYCKKCCRTIRESCESPE